MAGLICTYCGARYPHAHPTRFCPNDKRPLVPEANDPSTDPAAATESERVPSTVPFGLVFPWGELELRRGDEVLIGRSHPPVAPFYEDYPNVSADHARITVQERVEVTDLDSTNGTYIDGHKIEPGCPRPIEVGQTLWFSMMLRVQVVSRDAA